MPHHASGLRPSGSGRPREAGLRSRPRGARTREACMRRILVLAVVTTTISVGLLPAGVGGASGAPPDGVSVPGLTAAASVSRDANGIAHVRAGNEHDLFLLAGWVQAQDRLFQ